jgi:hypothetical protein
MRTGRDDLATHLHPRRTAVGARGRIRLTPESAVTQPASITSDCLSQWRFAHRRPRPRFEPADLACIGQSGLKLPAPGEGTHEGAPRL